MHATEVFGQFAARYHRTELPETVIHHAKRAVIDWYAALFPGLGAAPLAQLEQVLAEDLDRGSCRLGNGRMATARAAAPFLTWRLDPLSACMVAPNHQIIALTSRELELLGCLMATPGTMVAKQTLIEAMGYADVDDGFHRIESQLTRLRRKTLDISGLALPVRAVFGRGLVFVP